VITVLRPWAAPPADCEAFGDGALRQLVNAWSSLGYVAAGLVVIAAAARRRMAPPFVLFGLVIVAEGVGSVLYHGRPSDAAQALHDLALVGMLGFVAGWHTGRLSRGRLNSGRLGDRATVGASAGLAIGLGAGGVAAATGATNLATNLAVAVGVAVTVTTELVARRRSLPAVWRAGLTGALVVALATWAAGSADSPLCDPSSTWQWHGVWHLASALVALWWADAASGAASELTGAPPPQLMRRGVDRALGLAARALAHTFFRSIEVTPRNRLPRDRPVLLVANHPNGFVDPVVVVAACLGRMPRFLAKAALWKVVPARPLLALVGALPVHRRADGDRSEANTDVFAECHDALAAGNTVAIFPEGTTGDRATLDRVRSGAARIALGAAATVDDLAIVPVGLAFESRTATRPRAVLVVGEPVPHGDVGGSPDGVDRLTERIAAALAAVSPEFESVGEREVLRAGATVVAADRHRFRPPPFSEVETIARRAAAAPPPQRDAIDAALRDYATQLQLVGLSESQLGGRLDRRSLLVAAVLAALFGSVVITATVLHLPAVLLILVATAAVRSTATKGTVRLLVGLGAGILTWTIFGIVTADGPAAVAAGAVLAVEGQVALLVWPAFAALVGRCWGWARTRDRGELVVPVLASRAALASAVVDAERSAP